MSKSDNIRLSLNGLPIIQTLEDFADLTHISQYTLYQLSKNSNEYYKVFDIPKKSGGYRQISQPSKKLKAIQAWILFNILYKLNVSTSSKGFEKGHSIIDNAEPHKFSNEILTIDLRDFFPSINRSKVYNVFKTIGYNSVISAIFTNICSFEDSLPQGSPCSPRLANLILWTLDIRIQGYVGKRGITYTRYADDLTFSGLSPQKLINIYSTIRKIIEDEGFKINNNKTRMSGAARAKKVTGLVLSDQGFGIGHKKSNEIRSKIKHLTMTKEQTNLKLLSEVHGWLSYLNGVDKKRHQILKAYISKLALKYPSTLITKL
jgi:retron-type reverse transcriptase